MKNIKTILIGSALAFIGIQTMAQENEEPRYLLNAWNGKVHVSGFGAYTIGFSQVDDQFAVYNGGGGAVLLNQTFYIGGYGTGLSTRHETGDLTIKDTDGGISTYQNLNTQFGHGGFWLGYLHQSYKAIHFGFSTKLGWGSISLSDDNYNGDFDHDYHYYSIVNDRVFVVNPQFEVEFNLTKWFKINTGIGYQFVTGIDKTYTTADNNIVKFFDSRDFNQPMLNLSFVFGGFGGKR
ncbi:MAG: hypothetical protein JW731_04125 [Bacteroidales bacterium]|nr:hypothetical protein [Bacteroidales bacterium]